MKQLRGYVNSTGRFIVRGECPLIIVISAEAVTGNWRRGARAPGNRNTKQWQCENPCAYACFSRAVRRSAIVRYRDDNSHFEYSAVMCFSVWKQNGVDLTQRYGQWCDWGAFVFVFVDGLLNSPFFCLSYRRVDPHQVCSFEILPMNFLGSLNNPIRGLSRTVHVCA